MIEKNKLLVNKVEEHFSRLDASITHLERAERELLQSVNFVYRQRANVLMGKATGTVVDKNQLLELIDNVKRKINEESQSLKLVEELNQVISTLNSDLSSFERIEDSGEGICLYLNQNIVLKQESGEVCPEEPVLKQVITSTDKDMEHEQKNPNHSALSLSRIREYLRNLLGDKDGNNVAAIKERLTILLQELESLSDLRATPSQLTPQQWQKSVVIFTKMTPVLGEICQGINDLSILSVSSIESLTSSNIVSIISNGNELLTETSQSVTNSKLCSLLVNISEIIRDGSKVDHTSIFEQINQISDLSVALNAAFSQNYSGKRSGISINPYIEQARKLRAKLESMTQGQIEHSGVVYEQINFTKWSELEKNLEREICKIATGSENCNPTSFGWKDCSSQLSANIDTNLPNCIAEAAKDYRKSVREVYENLYTLYKDSADTENDVNNRKLVIAINESDAKRYKECRSLIDKNLKNNDLYHRGRSTLKSYFKYTFASDWPSDKAEIDRKCGYMLKEVQEPQNPSVVSLLQ